MSILIPLSETQAGVEGQRKTCMYTHIWDIYTLIIEIISLMTLCKPPFKIKIKNGNAMCAKRKKKKKKNQIMTSTSEIEWNQGFWESWHPKILVLTTMGLSGSLIQQFYTLITAISRSYFAKEIWSSFCHGDFHPYIYFKEIDIKPYHGKLVVN